MPKSVAQFAGMIVTAIVVFGVDTDVLYAVPLGVLAGALATFFVALSDETQKLVGTQVQGSEATFGVERL